MKVFNSTEKNFITNGLGFIDPLYCHEIKKIDMEAWELDCEVSIEYQDLIVKDNIAFVKTKEKGEQPFRIGEPEKNERTIKFKAYHVFFDGKGILLADVYVMNLNGSSALNWVNDRTDSPSPFIVTSDVSTVSSIRLVRKSLTDALYLIQDRWGGHLDADRFNIYLRSSVGRDTGETLIYGRDLESLTVYEDWSEVVTKLLPVGPSGLLLDELYLYSSTTYPTSYTKSITFEFETQDADGVELSETAQKNTLRQLGTTHLEKNASPRVNYSIKSDIPQDLMIGDKRTVKHPLVTITTEVLSYEYDVLSKRVLNLEFGNYTRSVQKAVGKITNQINEIKDNLVSQNEAILKQTNLIQYFAKLGHVYIGDNEIMILDKLPKEQAINVLRFNLGGMGFSTSGINGPYTNAWTIDGQLNADFIKAGSFSGDFIKSGLIMSNSGRSYINLDDDSFNFDNSFYKEGDYVYFGSEGDDLQIRVGNGQIAFMSAGKRVAYVEGQNLYIENGTFLKQVIIGAFGFIPRANGNLSLVKVG